MKIILILLIPFAFWVNQLTGQTADQHPADPNTYLKQIKSEMQIKWPENRTINIVFHGHSVPAGYFKTPIVNTLEAYPQRVLRKLKDLYPFAVINIIVTAIGGENSIQGAARFDNEILVHNPDILLIDYALNDRGPGLKDSQAAWTEMINKAKENNIKVLLVTPSPDKRNNFNDPDNELKRHTDQISQLAKEHGVGLVDVYDAFRFTYASEELMGSFMSQVNHPNERGHELIANQIIQWFIPDQTGYSLPPNEDSVKKWSEEFRSWKHHPDLVIPADPKIIGYEDVKMTDVPTVFQIPGNNKWYMSFIGFDGKGYQSFISESEDLIHWDNHQLAMGYGPEGSFDYGGVVLGAYLYESYDIKAPRVLRKSYGKYISLYGAYPRQGGYELRPGYEGLAESDDGLNWQRAQDEPILSVYQEDCGQWEKDCIYQPWLVEHQGMFYNVYNAANGSIEQMGLALSTDLYHWKRFSGNPVIPNGESGSFNEQFSSDIKIFRDTDHWVGFFFGVGRDGAHIMAAYSYDLKKWTVDPDPLYKAGDNPSGIDGRYAHKISLVWNPANQTYYMFYCAVDKDGNRGIGLITSK